MNITKTITYKPKIIFLWLLILGFVYISIGTVQAQQQRRPPPGRPPGNPPGRQKPPEFDALKMVGLYMFDIKDVIKALKIKEEDKADKTKKLVEDYNNAIDSIKLLERFRLNMFNNKIQPLLKAGNFGLIDIEMRTISKPLNEIMQKVINEKTKLDENLSSVLSKKRIKKWIKYSEKKINDFKANKPSR